MRARTSAGRGGGMIIHRAFIREVLQACGVVSAVLLSVFLTVRLMGFLRQAAEGDIPPGSVLLLLLLKTITYLDILAPLVLYIATLLVMGRWIRDNELTVISACGIGMTQFLKPALTLFAVVGAIAALFSFYLSPLSAEASRALTQELRQRADILGVIPGVFTETRDGKRVYFIESYDRESGDFRNLFVYDGGAATEDSVVVADVGRKIVDEKTGADFLVLENGTRYRGAAGVAEYAVLDFGIYRLRLEQRPRGDYTLPVKAMPTLSLLNENHAAAIGEFHWRIAKVIMLPVLMIFALAFSSITYRKNRFPGMLPALLVYFAYSNVLGFGVALIRRGVVEPHLALWVVHLVFFGLALCLLRRRNLNKRLLPGLSA